MRRATNSFVHGANRSRDKTFGSTTSDTVPSFLSSCFRSIAARGLDYVRRRVPRSSVKRFFTK